MKKFLSLVLALAMTMSLVTISAGAKDFTDADDITYVEAVEVMTAIGVVDGDTAGNFNPTNGLTRGAAAKIICNMILGPTTASALNADAAPYKDVAANSTFAGYIAFCQKEGIISGYADGTFKPAAPLTGYAFMKMLLGALGYDVEVEGYTGSNWSINVAKRALNIGLDDGLVGEFNGSAYITREEAMLYAFNALQADMVEYDAKTNISVGGAEVVIAGSKAEVVSQGNYKNTMGEANLQFAEKYFKDLRKDVSGTDDFLRPTTTWKVGKTEVGTYTKTPDLTYTVETKIGTIYSDLGLSDTVLAANAEFDVNGATEAAAMSTYAISKGNDTKLGGNGVILDVYYTEPELNDNGVVTTPEQVQVVLVNVYGGEVTSARAATAAKDANVTVTPLNAGKGGNFESDTLKVDDIVAYQFSEKSGSTGVKNVEIAEQVTGTLNGYTADKKVTVDGTVYEFNKAASIDSDKLTGAVKEEVTLTLDAYGYVLDVDTEASSTNYAVVLGTEDNTSGLNSDRAKLLFTDGTVEIVNLKTAATAVAKYDIVSYTINSKDEYSLTKLASKTTESTGTQLTTNGSSTIDLGSATKANGKTIFLVASKSGNDTVYTVYTGIANVPSIKVNATGSAADVTTYTKSGSAVTVAYIDATNASIASTSKDVVFIKNDTAPKASYTSEKNTYYTYDAVVNGEITTIDLDANTYARGLYTSISYGKDGVASLSGADGVTNSGTGTDRAANGAIGLNGAYYSYADDCEVFYIDADGNISTSSVAGISKDETDTVYFKETDGEITTIVIVDVVSSVATASVATVTTTSDNGKLWTPVVDNSGKYIRVYVGGTWVAGDTFTVSLTTANGASADDVTLTYDGLSMPTATVAITAEDGTVVTYTITTHYSAVAP